MPERRRLPPGTKTHGRLLQVPEHLVAVDPGSAKCGVAYYHRGTLREATTLQKPSAADVLAWLDARGVPWARATWVRERMFYYPDRHDSWASLDKVEDWAAALAKAAKFKWAAAWDAPTWKGPLPKLPHHARLAKALTREGELWVWSQPTTGEDGRDAVGIGLYAVGRVDKGGVARGESE